MNKVLRNILTYFILPVIIIGLVYFLVASIMEPVNFNKQKAFRESIAIQRLKDVRELQVAYKNVNAKYADNIVELQKFYNEGKIKVVMQVGSQDDSLAVANTKALKKKNPKIKPEQMLELYKEGQKLVFQIENDVLVKDTLFHSRTDFNIDSLAFIPFSGDSLQMESTIKTVSGVKVPLFEATMPYQSLLKGLDRQLLINLKAERRDQGRYEGLMVGSVSAPNNNAGNWE